MPDEDFRLADHARSQAHDSRLKTAGMTCRNPRATRSISNLVLEQLARQLCQLGAFAFLQIDVGVQRLPLHLFNQVAQPV